jgi:uncharacterized membrane protein
LHNLEWLQNIHQVSTIGFLSQSKAKVSINWRKSLQHEVASIIMKLLVATFGGANGLSTHPTIVKEFTSFLNIYCFVTKKLKQITICKHIKKCGCF